jgi:hypothetical protein
MDTGDLIEFRGNNMVSIMIRLITRKNVNHSALVVKFDFDGCGNRRYILESRGDGLNIHLLSDRLQHHSGKAYWSSLKPEYQGYRNRLAGWTLDKLGTKYDWGTLFKMIFVKTLLDVKLFICSEVIQAALEITGIIPEQKSIVRPGEFHQLGVYSHEIEIL